MREIANGIFAWGGAYPDMPWDLNGFAIRGNTGSILVDPPRPAATDWPKLEALKPILKIVITNRDHDRAALRLREHFQCPIAAGVNEMTGLASLKVDETVRDGDVLPGGLRVIHLPGKSPGEIGLYFDPARNKTSRQLGGIVLLGDALIGHPPHRLRFVPEHKIDNPAQLKESLRKLLVLQFEVLLLCDGHSLLKNARQKIEEFLAAQT